MSDNPRGEKGIGLQAWRIFRVFAGAFLLLAVVPATAECLNESYKLPLNSPREKLADGTYVVGSVTTKHGPLEARVVVRTGIVSESEFYLNGKQLREVSKENVPKSALSCLSKHSSLPISERIFEAARSISEAIVPPAYARGYCAPTFTLAERVCVTEGAFTECTDVIERTECGRHVYYWVDGDIF